MCLRCSISEVGRQRLGKLLGVLNCVLVVFGVILSIVALDIKVRIERRFELIEDHDSGVVTDFFIVLGGVIALVHLLGAKLGFDGGNHEKYDRNTTPSMQKACMVALVALSVVTTAAGLVCLQNHSVVRSSLDETFLQSMEIYKSNENAKEIVDRFQAEFKCCGAKKYSDWFSVSFIRREFVDTDLPIVKSKIRNGEVYMNDVPYSCCDPASPRPCIHHSVSDKSKHRYYSDVTLYKDGCSHAITTYMSDKVFVPLGYTVSVAAILQAVIVFLFRLLQSSMQDAYDFDDPEGDGDAFVLARIPCVMGSDNPARLIDEKAKRDEKKFKRQQKEKECQEPEDTGEE